jgi:hypothetical protein
MPPSKPRTIPPDLRVRLAKLVLMLSSEHDGERAAAANAIGNALKAAGLDWHDFVAGYATPAAAPPPPPPQPPPKAKAWADDIEDRDNARSDSTAISAETLTELITKLRASGRPFAQSSEDFLDDMLERANEYAMVFISPKQMMWLRSLSRQRGIKWSVHP